MVNLDPKTCYILSTQANDLSFLKLHHTKKDVQFTLTARVNVIPPILPLVVPIQIFGKMSSLIVYLDIVLLMRSHGLGIFDMGSEHQKAIRPLLFNSGRGT